MTPRTRLKCRLARALLSIATSVGSVFIRVAGPAELTALYNLVLARDPLGAVEPTEPGAVARAAPAVFLHMKQEQR